MARGVFSTPGMGRRRSQLVRLSRSLCYQEALGVAVVTTAHEGWLVGWFLDFGRRAVVCIGRCVYSGFVFRSLTPSSGAS